LITVGALRVPVSLLIPSETLRGLSVKALSAAWHVAQLTDLARSAEPGVVEKSLSELNLLRCLRIVFRVGYGW
jgi:hypothetical protein